MHIFSHSKFGIIRSLAPHGLKVMTKKFICVQSHVPIIDPKSALVLLRAGKSAVVCLEFAHTEVGRITA